jgi:hypothetical protein
MVRRAPVTLTITFHKVPRHAWWEARRRTGGRVRGGYMPIGRGRIPHDLGHLATEGHFGITDGFWGLLARGATFRHGTDQRATRPGRALIAEHRDGLRAAEALGDHHHGQWASGASTPVASVFDRFAAAWDATPDGGTLTVCWPSLEVS